MAPRPIRFIFLALCGIGMIAVTILRARDLFQQFGVWVGVGICSIVLGLGLIFSLLPYDKPLPFPRLL